jgi:hypothetical protein
MTTQIKTNLMGSSRSEADFMSGILTQPSYSAPGV